MAAHYFSPDPGGRHRPGQIEVRAGDTTFTLATDAGVFSRERLDPGTAVLLERLAIPPESGDVLDLGCGYGPIALSVAMRCPACTVWAVDVNDRALELVRHNARRLGVTNVRACEPDEVPGTVRFAALYSNPPIRIGKAALHELLLRWLRRLAPGGTGQLVVQRNLGADSLARWLTEQGFPTERTASSRGYRVLLTGSGCCRRG